MPIDVFHILDSFFNDLVLFFYNLVTSILRVFLHPFHGPIGLARRYRDKSIKQIGPWTFLVLAWLGYQMLLPGIFGSELDEAKGEIPALLLAGKSGTTFLRVLISAAVASIAVDAVVRVSIWLRWRKSSSRSRELAIGAIEYAVAAIVSFPALFIAVVEANGGNFVIEFIGIVAITLATVWIVAYSARRLLIPRRYKWRVRAAISLAFYAVSIGLLYLGLSAGSLADDQIRKLQQSLEPKAEVLDYACDLGSSPATFKMTVWNATGRPFVFGKARVSAMAASLDQPSELDQPLEGVAATLDPGVPNVEKDASRIIMPGEILRLAGQLDPDRSKIPVNSSYTCELGFSVQ